MKQICITECTVSEAMSQIDTLAELTPKSKGCLRLLAEEMFSMCKELLKTDKLDLEMRKTDNQYSLRIYVKTRVNEDARAHFLSMSSDGHNDANKGVKGIIGAVLETLSFDTDPDACSASLAYGMYMPGNEYTYMWSLSKYMDYTKKEKVKDEWDGMEKSIIANFADDVSIGVRSGKLEMTVTKTF